MDAPAIINGTQKDALDALSATLKEIVEQSTEIPPAWFIVGEDKKISVLVTPFMEPDQQKVKDTVRTFIALTLLKEKAVRYCFVGEAWALAVNPEDYKAGKCLKPSQSERRQEILSLLVVDADGSKTYRTFFIDRDADNLRSLRFDHDNSEVEGDMVGVFELAEKIKSRLPSQTALEELLKVFKTGLTSLTNLN